MTVWCGRNTCLHNCMEQCTLNSIGISIENGQCMCYESKSTKQTTEKE